MKDDIEYRLACLHDDIDRLEFCIYKIAAYLQKRHEVDKFIIGQILKIQCDVTWVNNKTPYRRLQQLEESFNNFLDYYHQQGQKKHGKKPTNKTGATPL